MTSPARAASVADLFEEADSLADLLVTPPPVDPMVSMLRAIIDTLPGNVFAKDRDGRYVIANAQTELALSTTRDQIIGRTDAEILDDGAQAAQLVEADRRVMASGLAETLEESVTLADGTTLTWLSTKAPLRDPYGRIAGVIGFSVDITARKAAEAALARNEAQLAAVLDALPVGVIVADAQGRIIRDNAANRELWGTAPATDRWEAYGEWVGYDPATGDRIAAADWALARALRNGDTVLGELVECERFGSGERRRYLNSAAPVRDAEGRIIGGVAAQLDVSGGLPGALGGAAN